MKRFSKMLGAFALCMGLLASPVQAEKFVVGFQPYDTISYQAIINAELGLWKKYTPEGTEIEFHPAVQGTVVASNMLADRAQIGYMSIMLTAAVRARQGQGQDGVHDGHVRRDPLLAHLSAQIRAGLQGQRSVGPLA
ncbi:MAG: hypothetical protein ACLT2T_05680 [Bilophila wadsworthia]